MIALTKSINTLGQGASCSHSQGSTASQNLLREPRAKCHAILVMGENTQTIFVGSHPSLCRWCILSLLLTRWCILGGLSTCTFLNHHKVGGFQDLFRQLQGVGFGHLRKQLGRLLQGPGDAVLSYGFNKVHPLRKNCHQKQ